MTTVETDTLQVLKLLAKGRPPKFVASALDLRETVVEVIANQHGWPDQGKLAQAVTRLSLCWCLCHTKESAMSNPENLDNPVAPDADLDDPNAPGNVGAPELGEPGEAEPLPDGDADDDGDGIPDEDDDDLADDDPEDIDDTEDDEALTGEPVIEPEDG